MTVKANVKVNPKVGIVLGLQELSGLSFNTNDFDIVTHTGTIDEDETMLRARISPSNEKYMGEINKPYKRVNATVVFEPYMQNDKPLKIYFDGDITTDKIVASMNKNNRIDVNKENISFVDNGDETYTISFNDLVIYGAIIAERAQAKIKLSSLTPNPANLLPPNVLRSLGPGLTEEEALIRCYNILIGEEHDLTDIVIKPTIDNSRDAPGNLWISVPITNEFFEVENFNVSYQKTLLNNALYAIGYVIYSDVDVTNNWYPSPSGLRRDLAKTHGLAINSDRVLEFRSEAYSTTNNRVRLSRFYSFVYYLNDTTPYFKVMKEPINIEKSFTEERLDMFEGTK